MRPSLLIPLGAALVLAAGCDAPRPRGWRNQPIPIRLEAGIPVVELLFDQQGPLLAAVASGSPLTTLQLGTSGVERAGELRLQDGAHPDVTRFIFFEQQVYDLPHEPIGLGRTLAVDGLLGYTVLSRFAVELSFGAEPQMILRDSVPDKDTEIASDCDVTHLLAGGAPTTPCAALIGATASGGGLTQVGPETIELPASRLVVPVCLVPTPFDPKAAKPAELTATGQPATALVATGLGVSVIARSAYERLIATPGVTVSAPAGAPQALGLAYGQEQVVEVVLPGLAIVHNETRDFGPCGELARRQRLLLASREGVIARDEEHNGASVLQLSKPLQFVILDDEAPLLAGLRNELRPLVADVDLLLGGSVLSNLRVTLDYPADRVILECDDALGPESCRVLPFCAAEGGDGPSCKP